MSFNFQVRIFTVVYPIYCTLFNSTHFFLRDIKFLRTLINFNFFFLKLQSDFEKGKTGQSWQDMFLTYIFCDVLTLMRIFNLFWFSQSGVFQNKLYK